MTQQKTAKAAPVRATFDDLPARGLAQMVCIVLTL
jgi:hypothetical protein